MFSECELLPYLSIHTHARMTRSLSHMPCALQYHYHHHGRVCASRD